MNEYDGSLIVLEGIDGSGTTTLSENLSQELPNTGYVFTQEPSTGRYGTIIREELQSDSDPTLSDFFLFMADRYDHVKSLVGPKLEEGTNVVCDRYHLSTMAYQSQVISEEYQNPYDYIEDVSNQWVIKPDLVLYLRIPTEESEERLDSEEKFEKDSILSGAKWRYDIFSQMFPFVETIDGTQTEEEVLNEALDYITKL